MVAVNRQAGSNAVEVAKSVKDMLPSFAPSFRARCASRQSMTVADDRQFRGRCTGDTGDRLRAGCGRDLFVSGRVTDTLIPAVALPCRFCMTVIAMRLFGYSLDNLSLMALTLAIGFLVDDAIVFLENTVRLMEKGMQPLEATLESAREISFTILSMTVSLAAVFFPLVFMSGLVGRIFREFAITIVVAIVASGSGVADADSADVRQAVEGPRATGSNKIGSSE